MSHIYTTRLEDKFLGINFSFKSPSTIIVLIIGSTHLSFEELAYESRETNLISYISMPFLIHG